MTCPICNNSVRHLYNLPNSFYIDYSEELHKIYYCSNCELEFKSLIYFPEKVQEYYKSLDDSYYSTLNKQRWDIEFFRDKLISYCEGGKVLDIGSGRGDFLNMLPSQNFQKFGVEPAGVKKIGDFYLFNDFVEKVDFKGLQFEVVTAFDLVEHLTDVTKFINIISTITKKNSIVIITTPNIKSITHKIFGKYWRHYLPFGHIILFSRNALGRIFGEANFELISCQSYDHRIKSKVSFYKLIKTIMLFPLKFFLNSVSPNQKRPLYIEMYKDYNIYIFKKK